MMQESEVKEWNGLIVGRKIHHLSCWFITCDPTPIFLDGRKERAELRFKKMLAEIPSIIWLVGGGDFSASMFTGKLFLQ